MNTWELRGDEGSFELHGRLDFDTVPAVFAETERLFAGRGDVHIDLSGVDCCNSAALALLLEWRAEAGRRRRRIGFRKLPEALIAMAQASELLHLLEA